MREHLLRSVVVLVLTTVATSAASLTPNTDLNPGEQSKLAESASEEFTHALERLDTTSGVTVQWRDDTGNGAAPLFTTIATISEKKHRDGAKFCVQQNAEFRMIGQNKELTSIIMMNEGATATLLDGLTGYICTEGTSDVYLTFNITNDAPPGTYLATFRLKYLVP